MFLVDFVQRFIDKKADEILMQTHKKNALPVTNVPNGLKPKKIIYVANPLLKDENFLSGNCNAIEGID